MLKRIALLAASLILFPSAAFCAIDNELISLDSRRNDLLKQLTDGLIKGKVTAANAQTIKDELDNVVKLETRAKEEPLTGPECINQINSSLQQSKSHIQAAIHPTKVWLGIDSQDKTLEQRITDALDKNKITKIQAESLKQEFDELRARESNGDPTRGFEFNDALALAGDIQTLSDKIDKTVAGK